MELKAQVRPGVEREVFEALDELAAYSVPMLSRMRIVLGPDQDLFCHRLRKLEDGTLEQLGVSVRYSAIALIGVASAQGGRALLNEPWSRTVKALGRALDRDLERTGFGDLGLFLWLDEFVEGAWTRKIEAELARRWRQGLRTADAVDRAWLMAGLTLNSRLDEATRERLLPTVLEALLQCHNPATGLTALNEYRPLSPWTSNRYRSVLGSFASQVYPLLALSLFLERRPDPKLMRLVECAGERICAMQGNLGEWWWTFDVRSGEVALDYPVYSVHQDGMAPMALLAAARVTGRRDYLTALLKGLRHLFEYREPRGGGGFLDDREGMIWRAVMKDAPGPDPADLPFGLYPAEMAWVRSRGLPGFLRRGEMIPAAARRVLREARPYCPGWILFAYSQAALAAGRGATKKELCG